jgi:hypothetical protein
MKKMVLLTMLMLIVLFAASCNRPEPAAPPASEPAPLSRPQPQYQIIEVVRHHNNIILEGAVRYMVQPGDILSGIAKRFYQDGSYYPLIMMASDDVVQDPDKIEPGMILTVPDLGRNIADTRAKYSMNSFFAKIADIEELRRRHETAVLIRNHT